MYYSISKDGIVISAKRITDLPVNDGVLCYVKRVEDSLEKYISIYGNPYEWFRYEFIDINNNKVNFKIGTCEVTFIAHDVACSYLKKREFTIKDYFGREGQFAITGEEQATGELFLEKIATKLVPFMLELSAMGGWDCYKHHKNLNIDSAPFVFDKI